MIDGEDHVQRLKPIWDVLAHDEELPGGRFFLLKIFPWGRILAGADLEVKRESFRVELNIPASAEKISLPHAFGYQMKMEGELDAVRSFSLVLADQSDVHIFEQICGEIWACIERHGAALETGRDVIELWAQRLHAWHRFLEKSRSQKLSADEECGLVGELYVLLRFIDAGFASERVLDAWCGPFHELHDYAEEGRALEVKTSRGSRLGSYMIQSEAQLDASQTAYLELGAVDLREDADGRTLSEWINLAGERLGVVLSEALYERLFRVGVHPFKPVCSGRRWSIERARFFHVDDRFPALRASGLPDGVYDVAYTLRPPEGELVMDESKIFLGDV